MKVTPPGGMTDLGAILLGAILVGTLVLTLVGLRRAIRSREALWILIVVLLPPLGAIISLVVLDSSGRRRDGM